MHPFFSKEYSRKKSQRISNEKNQKHKKITQNTHTHSEKKRKLNDAATQKPSQKEKKSNSCVHTLLHAMKKIKHVS